MANFLQKECYRWLAPCLFFVACVLAYGVQIPWLGFYLDDWIILNAYNLGGAARVFEYAFLDNRPLVSWIWILGLKLFGTQPIPLQVWALFWRWMSVVFIWLGWRKLWPKAPRQVTIAALLFAVYPLFRQQPSSPTMTFHWVCLFLFGLSIYSMIRAVQQPKYFLFWMTIAVLTGALELFSQEYYVGVELLRPVVLWLALRPYTPIWKGRLKRVFLAWMPFLLLLSGYLVWRMVSMPTAGADRNMPVMVYGVFQSPLSSLPKLATMLLQDMVEALLGVWYKAYQPDLFVFTPLANLVAWAVAGLMFFLAWIIFHHARPEIVKEQDGEKPWYTSAIPFGILAMLLGFAPGWAIDRHLYDLTGIYNDRFGLAATFGAAILIVALLDLLLKRESYVLLFACILIGLGAGQNFRFVTNYRYSWEKQRQLFWQLKWRVPAMKPGTAIIGDGAIISYMGSWATISSLLQMYAPDKNVQSVDYWYFDANDLLPDSLKGDGKVLADQKNYMQYRSSARNSLVIDFEPEKSQCLWILSETDQGSRTLPKTLVELLPLSNPGRIQAEPDVPLRQDIFGPEIPHDWCFYYQKGDLASQLKDWGMVVRLWKEAEQNGKHPRNGVEYRPFIKGFALTGDWQTAIDLTRKAYFPKYDMRALLCDSWKDVALSTLDDPVRNHALAEVMNEFECQDELKDLLANP